MTLSKAIDLKMQIKPLIKTIIKAAAKNEWNQEKICSEYNGIFNNYMQGAPRWLRSYLSGYWDALLECKVKSNIQFAYEHKNKLYGTTKKDAGFFPHYDKSGVPIQEISHLKSGFYYASGKAYYSSKQAV